MAVRLQMEAWTRTTDAAWRRRMPWRAAAAVIVGAAAFAALRMSGMPPAATDALIEMGFDPDRAALIAALLGGALVGAAAGLATGHRVAAGIAAFAGFAALFVGTFAEETRAALAAHGSEGVFDPTGWLLTLVALVMAGLVVAWAAAALAGDARGGVISAASVAATAARRRTIHPATAWKPVAVLVLMALLAVAGPAFGNMVNYAPDFMMRRGAPAELPLVAGSAAPSQNGAPGAAVAGPRIPAALPATLVPNANGTLATRGAVADQRPWLSQAPMGVGTVQSLTFPAPWTGGRTSTASVQVYLPPEYATGARRIRYTTIYEVPWNIHYWAYGAGIVTQLDALITSGQIPPTIVVFISADGGPYPDSECADSADGREHFDSFVARTVVPYIDAHYRTIRMPGARTVLGFSQGGYCSATLLMHHPDVFGNAIAMSGYYTAGPSDPQTVNAWRPFGHNQALLRADSPLLVAPTLPISVRSTLFVILTGSQTERFYGPDLEEFATVLTSNHYAVVVLPSGLGHAWKGVRSMLPTALTSLAGHQVATGVFRGIYP